MPITDWYYKSMYEEQLAGSTGGPPKADNGLLNGTMMNVAMTAGHYFNTTLAPGKKYRLRLVNTAVDNMFKVSLDSHTLTIIEADFVAIVPQYVTWLFLGIGQRYDVVFTANQTPGNYWFRAEVQSQCGNNANNKILAIFNYDTVPCGIPSSIRVNYTQSCADETGLVPYVAKSASKADFTFNAEDTLNVGLTQVNNNFVWTING
jgi:L-ascorbate oxidase